MPVLMLLTGCGTGGGGESGVGGGASATIVYQADQKTATVQELFFVGSGTKLNPHLVLPQTVKLQAFAITPDKQTVVYIADQDNPGVFELYRLYLAQPGVSTKLSSTLISGGKDVLSFKLIPDGSGVVYLADQDTDGVNELYRVLFSAPGSATKLNPNLTVGLNVVEFDITADSDSVVYRANQTILGAIELYRTVLTTNANAKLNPDYVAGQSVTKFGLLPNSRGALYLANQTTNTVVELYESVFGGSLGATVNHSLVSGGNVLDFAISPDSTRVVYRADQDTVGVNELYQVLLSLPTNSTKLNGPMAAPRGVSSLYVVTPDSASVVYVADETVAGQLELYRTVFSGFGKTRLLPGLITAPAAVYAVATIPDSSGVVYIADQTTTGTREVYRVLFSTPPTWAKLNQPYLAAGGQAREIAVTPDSGSVIYRADQTSPSVVELYRVFFTTASSSTTKLNGVLVSGGNVEAFAIR